METLYRPSSFKELIQFSLLEFLGTFMILNSINHTHGEPPVILTTIFAVSLIIGRITGAHFNPAVTVAIYAVEKKYKENFKILISFIIA